MKKILYIVIALVVIGMLAFGGKGEGGKTPATSNGTTTPIVIGSVLSLSGPAASFGEFSKDGIDMAVNEINKAGGINGREVKVIYEDDHTDAKGAITTFNKLINVNKVDGVIGGVWDFVSQPLIPLAESNRVAYISPSNFRIEGSFELNSNSFVMFTDFNKVIRKLGDYFKRDDVKKIGIVHSKSAFGEELKKTIGEVATELGKGPIVIEPYIAFGNHDFKTIISKLKKQQVDTLFIDMVDADTVSFLTQAKELGYTPKLVTYVGAYDAFKPENKSLLEGIVILNFETTSPEFAKRFKDIYGYAPAKSANRAYDALYVMAEAIANTESRDQVAKYIESHTFKTPNSTVVFLPTHQVENSDVRLDIYQNGVLVPLK